VIVNVFYAILCILCFCVLFCIVGSCKCRISGLVERINDDDNAKLTIDLYDARLIYEYKTSEDYH